MLAAVGVVFLRIEFEAHSRYYVFYTVPSSRVLVVDRCRKTLPSRYGPQWKRAWLFVADGTLENYHSEKYANSIS